MVRKTKEEAQATRAGILDAAEHLFHAQGVSRTSLQDIATAAGVTRGAVYWHFKDKIDLFNALMDRVCLPMEEATQALGRDADLPVVPALRTALLSVFERVALDAKLQRFVDIATHKIEYVDELVKVRERRLQIRQRYRATLERLLRLAQKRGELRAAPSARQMAIGLHALLDGMIQNWMLDPTGFDLRNAGRQAIDVHLAGLGAGGLNRQR
jgi:TetR/AcrR family acrAB operon transcriptional repressor